jgi:hypothetical protein
MSGGPGWTDQEHAVLRDLYRRGMLVPSIVRALPGRTEAAVRQRAHALGLKRVDSPDLEVPPADPRAASLLHLLDLKRAGYRQGFGELDIPPGDPAVAGANAQRLMARAGAVSSCFSSPAATCLEATL